MPKGLRNALLTLLVVFLTASPLWAQATSSLTGTVTDPTGAVIPGAEVKLTSQATGATRSTTTGANGVYIFPQLAPASYKVEVSAQGFKTAVFDRVVVQVGLTATLDVELEVGAIAEVVEVEAVFTPAINTADASVGNPFSELQIIQLPAQARNPVGILALQPGVVNSGGTNFDNLLMGSAIGLDARDGVVNGVRANQSNVTLDGADVNDQQNQTAFMSVVAPSLDSLQEFRVTTTNASATEGTAGGAQVAMITKSGSSDFHGNARYFHRNTKTAANLFFNNALGRDPVTGEKIADTPKLIRHLGGASFGGPIIPDRAFFFLDYELRRDSREL
ncbi:MAG: carboxypeptidase regulatory-like domain-containing protein, partial [Terriglobia bacterium]